MCVTFSAHPERSEKAKPTAEDSGREAPVPDFVGMGLQSAQGTAQAKGFHGLTSHDSPGRDRMQAFDRNGKVCGQAPGPGVKLKGQPVRITAVKFEEECP
ncbi:PASTA domain-containing protein [Streptomyces anulatus]